MRTKLTKVKKRASPIIARDFMPDSQIALRILKERANRIAKIENTKQKMETTSYIRFSLGNNEHYGIPYQFAKEVMHNVKPTKLPHVPKFIAGVINRRGALLAVLDLREFFNIPFSSDNTKTNIIIIATKHILVGIQANNIDGSDAFETDGLDSPLSIESSIKPEFILGLHKGVTAILNVEAIISDPKFQINK